MSHYHEAAIERDLLKYERVSHTVATRDLMHLEGFECKNANEQIGCLTRELVDYERCKMMGTMFSYILPDGKDISGIAICLSQEALDHLDSERKAPFRIEIIKPDRFNYLAGAWIPDADGLFEDMYIRTPLDTLRSYVRFRRVAVMPSSSNNECERLVG